MTSSTDRIEKEIVLRAPGEKVWKALTDYEAFGSWFKVKLESPFVIGGTVKGRITHPGYEYLTMEITVEAIDPKTFFSFRWHPYAIDPNVDYSAEPTTLVEFFLEEVQEGTRLTVVELGFDQIPASRRAEAYRMNEQGWAQQVKNIEAYVASS